jgi:hypothetical protein
MKVGLRFTPVKTAFALLACSLVLLADNCSGSTLTPIDTGSTPAASATVAASVTEATPTATPPPAPPVAAVTFPNGPANGSRGHYVTLVAHSSPNTACNIVVNYKSGPSVAQGLYAKTTSGSGNVSWTWFVGTSTTRGSWPIDVTCGDASGETSINVS